MNNPFAVLIVLLMAIGLPLVLMPVVRQIRAVVRMFGSGQ